MILDILLVVLGGALIVYGANFLTDGASDIAAHFNISKLIIGLTVVAYGTSTPELAVSVISAIDGNSGISVGNVIGSNIFNILAIIGITALIFPIPMPKGKNSSTMFDFVVAIVTAIVLWGMIKGFGIFKPDNITRIDGIILLVVGVAYVSWLIYNAKRYPETADVANETTNEEKPRKKRPIWLLVLMVIGGLVLLVVGARLFVNGSSSIASAIGVSDTLIGLTLVAWGTSLPELATTMVAAYKKQMDIAIGNIVGSNIFNILFVLGISATISPMKGLSFSTIDLAMQLAAPILLLLFAGKWSKSRVSRFEGGILLAIFAAYTAWIIYQAV